MIEFLDTSRKTAFAINEMHINPVEYFDFNFMISINYSFYMAQKTIFCEKKRFDDFRSDLMTLYQANSYDLFFSDYERNIDINMKKDKTGHILTNVTLRDFHDGFESHVYLEYIYDQSFLPDLIRQIDEDLMMISA